MGDLDILLIFCMKDGVIVELQNIKENKCHFKCPTPFEAGFGHWSKFTTVWRELKKQVIKYFVAAQVLLIYRSAYVNTMI